MWSGRSRFFAPPAERRAFRSPTLAKSDGGVREDVKSPRYCGQEKSEKASQGTSRLNPRTCRRIDQWVLDEAAGGPARETSITSPMWTLSECVCDRDWMVTLPSGWKA